MRPAPGPQRLFTVEPARQPAFEVVTENLGTIVRSGTLATAVIAAAAAARHGREAWIVAPDRWTASLRRHDDGSITVEADSPAPIDAIRRVLTQLPDEETS